MKPLRKIVLHSADGACKSKVMRVHLGAARTVRTYIAPRPMLDFTITYREYEYRGRQDGKGHDIFEEIVK